VRYLPGTRVTIRRSRVLISSLRSATAIPSITVRIVASGGKLAKFSTASSTMSARPSLLSRLRTVMISSVPGLAAPKPVAASTADSPTSSSARIQKSQNGWGSLLPTFSITAKPRKAARRIFDCGVTAVVAIGPLSSELGCFQTLSHRVDRFC
jgi:hypothetical protein